MKKYIFSTLLLGIFFIFHISYANLETYKLQLTKELMENIDIKFHELQKDKQLKKEEVLPEAKKMLTQLREVYKQSDFEYDIIQDLIEYLQIIEQQSEGGKEPQENSSPNQPGPQGTEGGQQGQQEKIQPRGPRIDISREAESGKKPLSESEKKQIEYELQQLQAEEKENMKLNKPTQERDVLDILREEFFSDREKVENDW